MALKKYIAPHGFYKQGEYVAPGGFVICDEKDASKTFIEVKEAPPPLPVEAPVPVQGPVVEPPSLQKRK